MQHALPPTLRRAPERAQRRPAPPGQELGRQLHVPRRVQDPHTLQRRKPQQLPRHRQGTSRPKGMGATMAATHAKAMVLQEITRDLVKSLMT